MAVKKKPPAGDTTQTARSKTFLQRLEESGGKRVVIDFDAEGHEALQHLLSLGYGTTMKDVVIRAVVAASARRTKRN